MSAVPQSRPAFGRNGNLVLSLDLVHLPRLDKSETWAALLWRCMMGVYYMQVDKQQFDTMLGKLLKAAPLPKAEIAPKRASPHLAPKRATKKQPRP